jgi:serine/threonine protein kinase
MDYVEGEDLESRLQRAQAPLPEDSVLSLADQVLDALTYLHNQQPKPIIHRDIKPANLRVNVQGRIKLVDFGLVKLLDSENPETKIELRGLGTPAYAPLEQFAGSEEHTDARADVYALGATMYQLLTNQVPVDVHQRLLHPPFLRPLRELNPQLSEQTEEVVLRAMAIHPDDRFQSADQTASPVSGVAFVVGVWSTGTADCADCIGWRRAFALQKPGPDHTAGPGPYSYCSTCGTV